MIDQSRDSGKYQIRIQIARQFTADARKNASVPALRPLYEILKAHDAQLKCQYDAFAEYCRAIEAEGSDPKPLYKWTKATIENPKKKEKYLRIFTIYVNGQEVYDKKNADELEIQLRALENGGVIEKVSKYDSNPANNPQPPKKFHA